MENYPFLDEYKLSTSNDAESEENIYKGFFTTKLINSLADGFSYKDEIFSVGLQLGISHSISTQLSSRYDNLLNYAADVILLWRETLNEGDFHACRKLSIVLRGVGFRGKASKLVSDFLKWVNDHVCCREIVETNAKYAIKKLSKSKKNTGLRQSVLTSFDKWCRQLRLSNNDFNMALYFQLFGSQLYENEEEYIPFFKTTLFYLNISLKHHLPHDAFYLTVMTNLDMENNVAVSASYLVKEINEFLHPRRLAKICDNFPDMDVVCKLAHALEIQEKNIQRIKYRHQGSLFMIAYDIIYAWKQDCPFLGEEEQVECLTNALVSIDMNGIAFEIEEEFKAWQMSPNLEYQICPCEITMKKRSIAALYDKIEPKPGRNSKCSRINE